MLSAREAALLDAAATIYATAAMSKDLPHMTTPELREACVDAAYALLDAITQREKANAPTSIQLDRCYWCSVALPAEGSAHLAGCPGRH